jgi:hypothetical protein
MSDETGVYLAGPVRDAPKGGREWREQLEWDYGVDYNLINPLDKYNISVEDLRVVSGTSDPDADDVVGVDDIVDEDIEMIRDSDGVLVGYADVGRMVGTPMEVMWARMHGYPVALWIRDDTDFEALSPWFRSMATALTNDAEMALRHIDRQSDGVKW